VGKRVTLNGHEFNVVGVAAEDFQGIGLGQNTDMWLPLMMQPQAIPRLSPGILEDRTAGWMSIYGRLKPGVRLEQARAEVAILAERAAHVHPATNDDRGADVVSDVGLYPDQRANLQRFLGLLFAAVGLVLLIACANVANLSLARTTARRREISVRLALGAGRSRLVRQLLTKSMLLCLVAAALGLLIVRRGAWGCRPGCCRPRTRYSRLHRLWISQYWVLRWRCRC